MKRFVPISVVVAIILSAGVLLLFSDSGDSSIEYTTIEIDSTSPRNAGYHLYCLYQATAAADPELFVDGSLFTVIRDQADWQQIWNHVLENGRRYPSGGCPDSGEPPELDVDFEQEMVVLLVEIQPSTGFSVDIDRIVVENGEWTVEATRTTPCCGVRGAFTYPHHVVSVPIFDGDVNLIITEVVSPTLESNQ